MLTIRDELSLAIAVEFYGYGNWKPIIKLLKQFHGDNHEMFSGNFCVALYEHWLDNLNLQKYINADPNQNIEPTYLVLKALADGHNELLILKLEQELWDYVFDNYIPREPPEPVVKHQKPLSMRMKRLFSIILRALKDHKHGSLFDVNCKTFNLDEPSIHDGHLHRISSRIRSHAYSSKVELEVDISYMCEVALVYQKDVNRKAQIISFKEFASKLIQETFAYL